MSYSAIEIYIRTILGHVPLWHWIIMGILSLTVSFLIRKRCSAHGALVLAITIFVSLFLLDAAVLTRCLYPSRQGYGFNLAMEYNRLLHGGEARWIEMLCNVAVFVPFGFFLSEFLSSTNRCRVKRRIGIVSLFALGLSLCVEFFQLILHVGWFEITDIVMNTSGAFVGTGMALMGRAVFGISTNK